MNLDRIIAVRNHKTIYRDGDKCIKVFDHGYSKSDILNEALNHARVEETGLNVPKIIEVTTIDGKWAIVSEYIKGKTLDRLMKENPDKYDEYLEQFVNLQLEVLSKRNPLLTKLKDKMHRKINLAELDETTKYDLQTRLESMPVYSELCHGDFNPSNIIIDENGTPYIIDWSHATQGNGCADASRTYLLFCLSGEHENGKKYLDLYCKKTGTSKRDIQKWMPIVAASQSVKGNKKEREFLLLWAGVVDYQ